ncbi:MAG: DUF4421 domain-containing protein [Muribaculaceae bacterium]|nr:DUF4421 domain-containing protein [Muribaculaceae bacterium]
MRMIIFKRIVLIILVSICTINETSAISLALDSVAEWGKFPKFCIDVYRWGDRTFNTYDSTYVEGTGKKFNIKLKTDSWLDFYEFDLKNNTQIRMVSNPNTSVGVSLTYLAVSAGYDINISNIFHGKEDVRKKWNFQFNCALFAADLYFSNNNVSTKITKFGKPGSRLELDVPFTGIDNSTFGADIYYFLNHKKYSQAAAFGYSKLQRKSAGSFYVGISLTFQDVNFDFSELPEDLKGYLPPDWKSEQYVLQSNNYGLMIGYGYNYAFAKRWLFGFSIAPTFGFRYGYVNTLEDSNYGFSLSNKAKIALIYNRNPWFAGLIGKQSLNLYAEKRHTFISSVLNFEAAFGFRFNIW